MKSLPALLLAACIIGCEAPDPIVAPDNRFSVYPNPAHEQAIITVNEQQLPFTVKVVNNHGKVIIDNASAGSQMQINFSIPEAGNYYVIFEMNGQKETQKLLAL